MSDAIMYGIPNCDTVKKARVFLNADGIAYRFHDYRKAGVPEAELRRWVGEQGWEMLLNRAGTTFRKLPDQDKRDLDAERAVALMLAHPAAIKRPVLVAGDALLVGFDPASYQAVRG